jgi:membrane associated rhomboid family serine protease
MIVTYIIIAACVIMSLAAFNDFSKFEKWKFSAYHVVHAKEQYRLITHAFIHGSWAHLFINMFVFWQFGGVVERNFAAMFGAKGTLYYIVLYLGGVLVASLPALKKHKDDYNYAAVGASGAVASVLFSYIIMHPVNLLYLFFIIPIPAFLVGILYLWYENRMENSQDNIAHDAHYWGAIYGAVVTILFKPVLAMDFVNQIVNTVSRLFS